ncbi:MAG: arginine--tRNA ligase, partial [Rubrivivax sp.]
MIQAKEELRQALAEVLRRLAPEVPLAAAFESPRQASHGDLAITAAMTLAKPLRRPPRDVATALVEALQREAAFQRWVQSLEIAGPGFVNLRLSPAARQSVVREVLEAGACFGHQAPQSGRLMVEFVSANPTGPLHVG